MNFLFDNIFILPLIIATILQLAFIFGLYARFPFYKRKVSFDPELLPVSVIIASKNEEENLREFLPLILQQDYPDFEVIVVDDQSEDDTLKYLLDLAKMNPRLKVVIIGEQVRDRQGKKFALSLGIKKSVHPILVFTDADCYPLSDQWLRLMARNYTEDKEIVIGYSPYERKNSLLNYFVQFDNFNTAMQYISFTLAGMPYMGVGRNMSYRKNLFMQVGYSSQLHIPYGDDDIFVNRNATKQNLALEIDRNSFMMTLPQASFKKWYRQKVRHLKGGLEYKQKHRFWLGINYISVFLFYACFTAALVVEPLSWMVWAIFGLRLLSYLTISGFVLKKLSNLRLIWLLPFLEIIYQLILLPLFSLIAKRSNKKTW